MCLGRWVSIEAFKLHETNVLAPSRICACTRKAAQRRTETARRLICAPWLRPPRSGLPPAKAPETCSRRYPRDRSTPTSTPRSMFSTTPPRSTRTSSRYSQTFLIQEVRRLVGYPSFGELVLGCIEADFCNQILILQHLSRSTR